jgi:serine/threonine-protein kinase
MMENIPPQGAFMPEPSLPNDAWLGQGFADSLPATPTPTPGAVTPGTVQDFSPQGASPTTAPYAPSPPEASTIPKEVPGYEILGELGRGGMGVVYKARQVALNRLVALKMILGGQFSSASDVARFRKEAEAIARLSHPHIVQVYDVGVFEGLPYCALEYVPGGSLDRVLGSQPQPPREAAALVAKIAQGMQAAHEAGIVHRDLKPANILLAAASSQLSVASKEASDATLPTDHWPLTTVQPKITDFGLAKRLEEGDGQTRTGELLGTPSYMAPEQAAARHQEIGPAADIYALGAILYEMLTGRPPFKGLSALDTVMQVQTAEPVSPSRLQMKIPRDLETICLKCLSKEPYQRYLTAAALAEDLERFLHGETIQARPVGRAERAWRWCRRNPVVASLAAALLLALLGGLVGMTFLYFQAQASATLALQERDEARRQRARADAHYFQAQASATLALQERDEARRQRARADSHLVLAREALDKAVNKVADNSKLREADFTPLRKELLTTALPFYEQLASLVSDEPDLEVERAQTIYRMAILKRELGDFPAALQNVDAALAILTKQAASHPDKSKYRYELSQCLASRGTLLEALGQRKEAATVYRQAAEMQEKLVAADPKQAAYHGALGITYNGLATLAVKEEQLPQAAQALQRARAEFNQALELAPKFTLYRKEMGVVLGNLAVILDRQGKENEALEIYQANIQEREKLLAELPQDPDVRDELGRACYNLGNLLDKKGKRAEAEQLYRRSLALREKLVADFPTIPYYRVHLTSTLNNLAMNLSHRGEKPEAEKLLKQAFQVREKLVADFPHIPAHAVEFGGTACNMGHQEMGRAHPEAALVYYDKSITALDAALAREPKVASGREFLCNALVGKAAALQMLRRPEEAIPVWDRVLKLAPPALKTRFRLHRTLALAQAGEHVKAFAAVEELSNGQRLSGEVCLHLASVCALSAAAAEGQKPLVEKYTTRAMALLRQAQATGYFKNPAHYLALKTGADLNALRGLPEFEKLLAEVAAPSTK